MLLKFLIFEQRSYHIFFPRTALLNRSLRQNKAHFKKIRRGIEKENSGELYFLKLPPTYFCVFFFFVNLVKKKS